MALLHTNRRYYSDILTGIFYYLAMAMFQGSVLMAASVAGPDEFEAGVAAFYRGDFAAASRVMAGYVEHGTKQLPAKAYIFAMRDQKPADPELAPSEELKAFIVLHSTSEDPFYSALSAKLHLMGYHPESNLQTGLMVLGGLGELEGNTRAYALYTLGLYREGLFTFPLTFPPIPVVLQMAQYKYAEASTIGHKAAMERYTLVFQLLNPEPVGSWEGEDDGVSHLEDVSSRDPRDEAQGDHGARGGAASSSGDPSIISHQTGGRFYGDASVASVISADSEAPKQVVPDSSTSSLIAARPELGVKPPRQGMPTRASTVTVPLVAVPPHRDSAIVPVPQIPGIVVGHETLYQRFLEGRLEYRPTPGRDEGLTILSFRELLASSTGAVNPLSGTFNLSGCGDAGQHISINIGYKKAKNSANFDKTEIWICPKFLVERELATTASYLTSIMGKWSAPVGYFWTWGNYESTEEYEYFLKGTTIDKNLHEIYAATTTSSGSIASFIAPGLENFIVRFPPQN